jgi:hypothetical protein
MDLIFLLGVMAVALLALAVGLGHRLRWFNDLRNRRDVTKGSRLPPEWLRRIGGM